MNILNMPSHPVKQQQDLQDIDGILKKGTFKRFLAIYSNLVPD
jgi:hypothetical protein